MNGALIRLEIAPDGVTKQLFLVAVIKGGKQIQKIEIKSSG